MSQVEADIEALKTLRQALRAFANRQSEALQAAEAEITYTLASLEEAEAYWRREVERRRWELNACLAQMDYEGYYVDCSSYERTLDAAEQELEQVIRWRVQVEEAAAEYRRVAQRLTDLLQNELPRASTFLANRITALEAYYASQLLGAATALAGAGVSGVIGSVVAAIRHSQGKFSRIMGSMSEQIAAQVLSEKFGLQEVPFDQPHQGFDRVFQAPGMPLVVMESKVSSSGQLRLGRTHAGEQGSPEWISATATRMADPLSAQWSPANERIAGLVHELEPGNVPVAAVVVNPETESTDIYWRQSGGGWQRLEKEG
jgi:hypothetical protein